MDKVAFIGSTATAKKVMATCAETLTPLLAECGGKDAMIVDADGDLDAAADAALWGGLCNAGQTCTGIERVYVASAVADEFIHRLVTEAQKLKVGVDDDATLGPIIMPAQVGTIRRHIADGVADGGAAALGGAEAVQPPYVQPTILVDVPEDSTAVQEETFGPVLVVNRVRDAEEGIARANALPYALGGSVFARRRGLELARRRARPGRDRTACRDRHAPAPRPLLAGPTAKHGGAFPTLAMERRPRGRRENRRGTTGPHRSPAGVQRMLSSPGR